ncbi:MAG: Flagellar hook-length control protein [Luteibacter sp.]|uniref:flagellar hook-length control protein FliK n=1 Tax=Luteibacter sp. TaxID=1886636 RepID=UPI001383560D|nr:flagellar hook-length control protein FliK [Luteibacter sp.]KAF1005535.1 MAG: Flagellar hook-length control protein [Luteibacter sp.]
MNNASLALNASRPSTPTNNVSSSGQGANDGSPSSQRFDTAMDAARADAHKPQRDDASKTKDQGATKGAATKSTDAKPAKKADDETARKSDKDATKDGDTSVANAMLALIGAPPPAQVAAVKLPDAASELADKAMASLDGAPMSPLGAGAAVVTGAEQGVLGMSPTAAVADATPAIAAPIFGALLAAQGGDAATGKDDARATDPTQSPMPALQAAGMAPADGQLLQVQSTQPAASPQFAQELGEQIAWMGSGQVKEARIKLHPEELGSMDVRVNMDGGKVNVAIIAQHPAAVHAVQQTLSQLDSMLAHHGLALGQADVGQRQQGQGGGEASSSSTGQGGSGTDADATSTTVATSAVSRGLLDEVA